MLALDRSRNRASARVALAATVRGPSVSWDSLPTSRVPGLGDSTVLTVDARWAEWLERCLEVTDRAQGQR